METATLPAAPPKPSSGRDEVDVVQITMLLWSRKWWVITGTTAFTILGILYALMAKPVYYSEAIIALKEREKGSGDASRVLAQLGGIGGAVAAQLGGGNASLDKLEIILKGRDLAETVIKNHDLMPILFPDKWDVKERRWLTKDSSKVPGIRMGINRLRKGLLSVSPDMKKGVINVGIRNRDPEIAKRLVDYYLEELNNKIRNDVITDAEINRSFLEKQSGNTLDPFLLEKIQNMIAYEIEKNMLVSSKSFDILERPFVPFEKISPKRGKIAMASCVLGMVFSVLLILAIRMLLNLKASALEYPR